MRFPARIGGGYRSGKTTRLRALARELLDPLVICATEAAAAEFGMGATTFWGVAAGIVARHHRPVRVLSSAEQRERLGGVWVQEIAQYQASFLGREELRTHAQAAGVYDHWERIADAADDYLARLDAAGEADWAGVLVRASLLLRHEDVLAAERARFSHVLVDDFEAASFATNRLLAQLVGFGGPVAVAGNQAADLWRHLGGSPRYLDRFPSRFGAVQEVVLDAQYQSEGEGSVTLMLVAGGDPWLALPSGQPLPAPLATSLFWDSATLIHVPMNDWPPDPPVDVLAGPDVPSDEERRHRRQREDDVRRKFAASRARRVEVGQWSR